MTNPSKTGWAKSLLVFGLGAACGYVGLNYLIPSSSNTAAHDSAANDSAANNGAAAVPFSSSSIPPSSSVTSPSQRALSLTEITQISSEFEQSLALYRMLSTATADDIILLLEDAKTSVPGYDYVGATSIMYGRLAELDIYAALDRALADSGPAQAHWINAIFHALARLDLDQATLLAATLSPEHKGVAARAMLRSRDDLPRTELLAIADDLNTAPPLNPFADDPRAAWEESKSIQNRDTRYRRQYQILMQWAQLDPAQALAMTNDLPQNYAQGLQMQITSKWAASDFDAAWRWVNENVDGRSQSQLSTRLIGQLAERDLEGARLLSDTLPEQIKNNALQQIIPAWAKQDPQDLLAWLDQQSSPEVRTMMINQATNAFALHNPDYLDVLLERLDPDAQQQARQMLVSVLAHTQPDRAIPQIEAISDPRQRLQASQTLLSNWVRQDRRAAEKWLESLNAEESATLYQTYMQSWSQWDENAAMQYAERIRDPELRDNAMLGLVHSFSDVNALEVVYAEITDPEIKRRFARYLHRRLQQVDPVRAETYRLNDNRQ